MRKKQNGLIGKKNWILGADSAAAQHLGILKTLAIHRVRQTTSMIRPNSLPMPGAVFLDKNRPVNTAMATGKI